MNSQETRASQIEALLFALGEPLSRKELAAALGADASAVEGALGFMKGGRGGRPRGIVLVDDGQAVELRVSSECAPLVEKVRKEAYAREVGKAGLEVLAAVLYQGPLSRSQIDFIRGVHSAQTLRTLTMRGLLRKMPKPGDERSFIYEATTELLASLGVPSASALLDFESVRGKLAALQQSVEGAAQHPPKEKNADL